MCEPISLSILAVAGAGASAYSAVKQTEAQNEASEYNARIADRNAKYSEVLARDAEKRGQKEVQTRRQQVRAFFGEQKSAISKAGVVLSEGSAVDLLRTTQEQGELDAMQIKANAAKEAQGFRLQGLNYQSQSQLLRAGRRDPTEAGALSLLTRAGSLGARFAG